MKLLFVIHGIYNKAIETAYKKKQMIRSRLGCTVDSCIYAEEGDLGQLALGALGGKIYTLPVKTCAADIIARSLYQLVKEMQYTAVVVADGFQAGELALQLAQLLEVQCMTAVTELAAVHGGIFCSKMAYNNMICADYRLPSEFVVSERLNVGNITDEQPEPLEITRLTPCGSPEYILDDTIIKERKEQTVSPILIAAGMGIQSKEEIIKIREYAEGCRFSFGVSRPVAMRGWADISEIIGVSGEIYAPRVTVAVGISGAAAFMAGIEQSHYILSVNSNPDAPIVHLSDAVIIGEYQNILPELMDYLKQWRQMSKEKDC